MFKAAYLTTLMMFAAVTGLTAQPAVYSAQAAFARAQDLASEGNSAAGRAIIDSIIRTTPPASPVYPQALFWRATLATSAAAAESDYRHIVVDYPLAPHAEDALLRLAQLELARGDRDDALVHLQRIPRDYPRSKSIARAHYWTARVLFEKNDVTRACAANASALANAGEGEVELRNQIQYQSQRCAAHAAAQRAANEAATASSTPAGAAPPESVSTVAVQPPAPVAASGATASSTPPVIEMPVATAPKTETAVTMTPATTRITTRANGRSYSVQVAAYNQKSAADKLVATLADRGYEARVDGGVAPFRVRIGRYLTAAEAEAALREIKSKRMDGFVVRAP